MILQRLVEYYESRNIESEVPRMYDKEFVKWIIDIDLKGRIKGKGFIRMSDGSGGKKDRGKEMPVPYFPGTSNTIKKLLCHKAEYVLGNVSRDPDKTHKKIVKKSHEKHTSFVNLVKECAESTREVEVTAVQEFFKETDLDKLDIPEDLKKEDKITFRVNDTVFPIDLPSVREFWARKSFEMLKKRKIDGTKCIVCGEDRPFLERHPFKIKGIPGGHSSGVPIISANENAYWSYGLENSYIAPTCAECAEKYAKAINRLIASSNNSIEIGALKYVFWTREPTVFSLQIFDNPKPEEVKALLDSVRSGESHDLILDKESFYASALSASKGSVVIRDWLEMTVGNVKKNLAKWFKLQKLINYDGKEGHPLGSFILAASLLKKKNREEVMKAWRKGSFTYATSLFMKSRDISANVPGSLFSSAIKGLPLPKDLLFKAIKRNHAERDITRPRAVLIKMVINSNNNYKEDYMEKLETTEKNPAYLCGRLLAELENLQYAAIGSSTLTDRFYGTASSAPASVFGTLLRKANYHRGKLRKEKKGVFEAIQERLEEIQSELFYFPKTLTLEEQGLFSLGYYHQKAHNRAEARKYKLEKSEEKQKVEV